MQELIWFLGDQGVDVEDRDAREYGRRLVRDATDEVLSSADELELKRLENAELTFRAVQEDLAKRGVISPITAYERYHDHFGTAG